jgi:hypothetical protein
MADHRAHRARTEGDGGAPLVTTPSRTMAYNFHTRPAIVWHRRDSLDRLTKAAQARRGTRGRDAKRGAYGRRTASAIVRSNAR